MLAILQNIYLLINIIGVVIGLYTLFSEAELLFISSFFSFISRRLGNVFLAIISIALILLFIPTLTIMTVLMTFIMLWGEYSN